MKHNYTTILAKALSIVGIATLATTANAQVNIYSFAQSTGSYTPITGATVLDSTTSTVSLDDEIYPVTLPFTFVFNGVSTTDIVVSTNGFITIGSNSPSTTLYTPISSTTMFDGVISAWGRDLNSFNNIGGKRGSISYTVSGVAPNRIFTIEWTNFRPIYSSTTTNVYGQSFQIMLKETSNIINVMYGPGAYAIGNTAITSTTEPQIGLRGATNADFNNRTNTATTLFTASTVGTLNTSTQAFNTAVATPGMPTSGLTYTWTPPLPCTGTPTAGTIAASLVMPCPNTPFTINIMGSTAASGITTAWQESTNGSSWLSTGDSTMVITNSGLAKGDSTYYRVAVSCNGAAPVYTNVLKVKTNPNFMQCYCTADLHGGTGPAIDSVSITGSNFKNANVGIPNTTTGYSAFAATGDIKPGLTYTFNLVAASTSIASFWIDYDQSGSFDSTEWKQIAVTTVAGNNAVSFTVPANAILGNTGLRVRTRGTGNSNGALDACSLFFSGETEDYIINITNTPVGLQAINNTNNYTVYPNPTSGLVNVVSSNNNNEIVTLEVVNSLGQIIATKTLNNLNAGQIVSFDLSAYNNGLYLLRTLSNNKVTINRVVLQR
jgi:hypothetical protein